MRDAVVWQADRAICGNLVVGGIMYVLVAILARYIAPSLIDQMLSRLLDLMLVATVASLVIRIICVLTFARLHARDAMFWQWLAASSAILVAAAWGALSGYVTWLQPGSFEAMAFALISAGIAIGIFTVFAPMLPICVMCFLLLLLPLVYGLVLDGSAQSVGISIAFALFGVYMIILAFNRYNEVWDRTIKAEMLEARNEELLDLTQRLELANEQAMAASAAKSQFIANTSHELRTPLHSILGNAELLHADKLSSRHHGFVDSIFKAGKSLLYLVNDLIDLSHIESGQLKVEIEAVGLRSLVADVDNELRLAAGDKGLSLDCIVDDAAPEWVALDGLRLRQIIINLMSNAIKYTNVGQVRLYVCHDGATAALEVYVSDTGPGVPMNKRDRIFGEFVQLEGSASRRHQGVGLGLAISKRLVEAMRGRIGVDSSLGVGSTFWFSLPATSVDPPEKRRQPQRIDPLGTVSNASVLVVDDNHSNRLMVAEQIRLLGFHCESVDSGQAAIDRLSRSNAGFDVVLMDSQMPEMDGYEAVRRIRQLDSPLAFVPVVALTANAMPEERAKCLQAGMNDYLTKPASIAQLKYVVSRWFGTVASGKPLSSANQDAEVPLTQLPATELICEERVNELAELRCQLGPKNLQLAFDAFQADVYARMEELIQYASAEEYESAERSCHAVKGMFLDFGLPGLSRQIAELEQRAHNQLITPDFVRKQALDGEFRACVTYLAERLGLSQSEFSPEV